MLQDNSSNQGANGDPGATISRPGKKRRRKREEKYPPDPAIALAESGDLEGLIDHYSGRDGEFSTGVEKLKWVRRAIAVHGACGSHELAERALGMVLQFSLEQWARALIMFRTRMKPDDDRYTKFSDLPDKAVKEDLPRLQRLQENILHLVKASVTFEHLKDVRSRNAKKSVAPAPSPDPGGGRTKEKEPVECTSSITLPKGPGYRRVLREQGFEEQTGDLWIRGKKLAPDRLECDFLQLPEDFPTGE